MKLEIKGLCTAIRNVPILHSVDLSVEEGGFLSLLGPSGCGKSTFLKTVAGILPSTDGTIHMRGQDLTRLPAHRRNAVIVFQDLRLFPNMSVLENVAFPLKMRGIAKADRFRTARDMLSQVQMEGYEDRRVSELSGGQQQRAALARALAARPQLLLLDEPFSALDENLRGEMRALVKKLHRSFGMTTILVTHDREEALSMSDQTAVMFSGRIVQSGTPRELYLHPVDRRVADYFGGHVYLPGRVEGGVFRSRYISLPVQAADGNYDILLRYDALCPDASGPLTATVTELRFLGAQSEATLRTEDGLVWKQMLKDAAGWSVGEQLRCSVDISQYELFPSDSAD